MAALAVAVVLLVVPGAAAPATTLTGRDREHGARFALTGRTLAVSFATLRSARGFRGLPVRVECVQPLFAGDGPVRRARWASASRTLKVRLPYGPGSAPVFCSVVTTSRRAPTASIAATLK